MLGSEPELHRLPQCGLAAASHRPAAAFPVMGRSWVVVMVAISVHWLHGLSPSLSPIQTPLPPSEGVL